MNFKNVDNFNIEDCELYLSSNQNNSQDSFYKEVLNRYNVLLNARKEQQDVNRLNRKQEIVDLRNKTKWIDIDQFLDTRDYYILSKFRFFLYLLFSISFVLILVLINYTGFKHMMYSTSEAEQIMQTSGMENVLLKFDMIRISWDVYEDDIPCYRTYRLADGGFAPIVVFIGSFLLLLFTSLFNSSVIKKIYNIQDGEKKECYRAIENKKGKKGICRAGRFKMRCVLPIEYDDIFAIYENSYVCAKNGKYGVYNTDLKKMTIPVVYDDIYSIDSNSIVLIKDNNQYSFTNKGFRLVK